MKKASITKESAETFALVLSPFAPHLAEELWELYGNKGSISHQRFPECNESLLHEDAFEYPVSFNGKTRFKLVLPLAMQASEAEKTVKADPQSVKWTEGKQIKKIVFVPGKIINVVVA